VAYRSRAIHFNSPIVSGTIVPMDFSLQDIFATQPISGITINTVGLSPSFIFFIYVFIAVILVFSGAFFLMKKSSIVSALKKAFIVTFFSAGLIYAIHADIGWSSWLMNDARTYAGLDTAQKLLKMEGAIYALALEAHSRIPRDYMLFSANEYAKLREEYFLLPLRKRDQSDYIVVLGDPDAHYDAVTRTFSRHSLTISPVEPVFMPPGNVYILKRKP
jgi:hypothetical protein